MDTIETQNNQTPNFTQDKKEGKGLWSIIIVIMILLVGVFLLLSGEKREEVQNENSLGETTNTTDVTIEDEFAVPEITDTSDDTASIIEDIESMDFSNIDQGL